MKLPAVPIRMLAMLSILSTPLALASPSTSGVSGTIASDSLPPIPSRPVLGQQRVLLVVGRWADGSTTDPKVQWNQVFGADSQSLRSWTLASSMGRATLDPVQTPDGNQMLIADFGERPTGNCGSSDMHARAREAAAKVNINREDYDYLFVAVKCQGGALAAVPGHTITLFGQGANAHVWRHEYGHNLGTSHPGMYINCPVADGSLQAPEGCATRATNDPGDPTGGGSTHYPGITRAFAGWLDHTEHGLFTTTGLYSLTDLGAPGPQLYLFQSPQDNRYLSFEYRRDADVPANGGIWIRYSHIGGSVKSVLVNASPTGNDLKQPQLKAGQVFTDTQAGLKVKVCSANQNATLAVALGDDPLPACDGVAVANLKTPTHNGTATQYPMFTGTGIPGAQVRVAQSSNPQNILATTHVDARGEWRVLAEKELPVGRYSVSTMQFVDGKRSSWGANIRFVVEQAKLTQPVIETPVANLLTGQHPIVSGNAIPGATVRIVRSHAPGHVLGEVRADGHGHWSLLLSKPLPEGAYSVAARQWFNGQWSSWSLDRAFQVTTEVAPPVIEEPAVGALVTTSPLISGTALPGARIAVHRSHNPGTSLGFTQADGHGNWSIRLKGPLPIGNFSISTRQTAMSKVSSWSANRAFKVVETDH
ncbi:hypothetical protein ACNFG0_19060 [Pseudomonas sp. NY15372]|uniref:hypothetical protein n=1 Tax=Pseudomonas sp. NY15372 TaxID=3400356 RepID=UPI003A8AD1F5